MKNLFVLLFAVIAVSEVQLIDIPGAGVLGLLGSGAYKGLLGGGGAGELVKGGNGITEGLLKKGAILPLGQILGLKNTKCIELCPLPIADTDLKCVKPTTFPKVPICYGRNTRNKWIFPCQENGKAKPKPKPKPKPIEEEEVFEEED